jgi:hypothetical protein
VVYDEDAGHFVMRRRWSCRRHRCNGRCGNRFSTSTLKTANSQERERRRERLNSEAAERAHEAATRRRKIESGAE